MSTRPSRLENVFQANGPKRRVQRSNADPHDESAPNEVVMIVRQVVAGLGARRLNHHWQTDTDYRRRCSDRGEPRHIRTRRYGASLLERSHERSLPRPEDAEDAAGFDPCAA